MKITSIQSNNTNTNFNGLLTVRNLQKKQTKIYKLSAKNDLKLIELHKQMHFLKPISFDDRLKHIKNYIDEIFNITEDNFIKELPLPTAEDIASKNILTQNALYRSFSAGEYFTEFNSNNIEISHDLKK